MSKINMENALPQEIDVWYVLPAIRRELAKLFIQHYDLSQKQAAEKLGITEAAISQYVNDKRAHELKFNHKEIEKIKGTAELFMKDEKNKMAHLSRLLYSLRGCDSICGLHRKFDKCIPESCDVCMNK